MAIWWTVFAMFSFGLNVCGRIVIQSQTLGFELILPAFTGKIR